MTLSTAAAEPQAPALESKDQVIEVPIDESQLPVDLRTDRISDAENILHWSSGGFESKKDETIHGTADLPLTMGSEM